MDRQKSKENVALDVKPLRTLSPMFPSTFGLNTFTESQTSPFVYVSSSDNPAIPFPCAPNNNNQPSFTNPTQPVTPIIINKSHPYSCHTPPNNIASPLDNVAKTLVSSRKIKQPTHFSSYYGSGSSITDGSDASLQKKKPKKAQKVDLGLVPSLLDPKDAVEVVLMTFDALRRRLSQLDDGKEVKISQRPDLKAGNTLMTNDIRANVGKRLGPVPGVEVGDIFYFRIEMCLVGLHCPIMAGIDYMMLNFNDGEDTVADSIVSAGGYENEETDADTLIYTGQGGNANVDQKLERGNLALERSLHRGCAIRVIRGAKDPNVVNGRIYYYDGLYKVEKSWVEKGKMGFNIFKYQLLRQPEQPPGLAIWKSTQQWKDDPSSRPGVILPDISSGIENIPVCLVNEVDNEKGPSHFRYSNTVKYLNPVNSLKPLELCRCFSVCLPGDVNCKCANLNGGIFPYSASGTLVCRKPIIYECNESCCCSSNCRNRFTQKGITLQFEVFKTINKGWGLRCWDPIRAGTFICEYTGEIINKININGENAEDDEYIFQAVGADEKAFRWNYGPELMGEPSSQFSSDTLGQLPIVISAKNIGNISRFINHSCSPNVFWQPVLHDHGDEQYPHIMFFAMKHIPPMTELTYDHGQSGSAGSCRTKECLCGSQKCRGRFG